MVAVACLPLVGLLLGNGRAGGTADAGLSAFACLVLPIVLIYLIARWLVAATRGLADRRRADRQWRLDHHVCLACGYDVRATPGQCPECGARQERWWA